jgi:hypothetical protein
MFRKYARGQRVIFS